MWKKNILLQKIEAKKQKIEGLKGWSAYELERVAHGDVWVGLVGSLGFQ